MLRNSNYHILLLPRQNYWAWVDAVREYVAHFGASVTPSPENALQFHNPEQVISVIVAVGGYPQYGNVIHWLKGQSPDVVLDVLRVDGPDHLQGIMAERIASGLQFGETLTEQQPNSAFCLLWPTDYRTVTQGFGENPGLYRRWNLPGHEGVDFRAPTNSNVYACADGEVYLVHDGSENHPYGIHVRILHQGGYRTVYAHLNQALVHTGQVVDAGELIGLADSTGNSVGHHLHLTLKKDGATAAGLTPYPYDIIDPTPFLLPVTSSYPLETLPDMWDYPNCLVGLMGRMGGPMEGPDWEVVRTARIEALALTTSAVPADVEQAYVIEPSMFIMMYLTSDFQSRVLRPADFVHSVAHGAKCMYECGVRYFEIHNEPNLMPEGYGVNWQDGHEFGEWFLQVVGMLQAELPDARFGWPGLSPGPTVEGMRLDHRIFMDSAQDAIRQADWIGCHCHWQDEAGMLSESGGLGYKTYRKMWPDKLLLITECGNTVRDVDGETKGNQYLKYYSHLRTQSGVGAAFAAVASASANYPHEVWRSEDGRLLPIASIVGARSF
ncbi:MAG: M23 family metallopeptidase [Anaerolineae bacterium]|nr:M23 family metallopeptidase [Anaerolineae bacterium]